MNMKGAPKKDNLRKRFAFCIRPELKEYAAKKALEDNLSFSRFLENLILQSKRESERAAK